MTFERIELERQLKIIGSGRQHRIFCGRWRPPVASLWRRFRGVFA